MSETDPLSGYPPMKKRNGFFRSVPFRLVVIYAAVSLLWIYFSDMLLNALVHDRRIVTQVSVFKGFLFIFITSVLLYSLVRRDMLKILQREQILRESEEKFRNLFNNVEVGMFRSRFDGSKLLDVNDKYLSILGWTRGEILGKPSRTLWADPGEREEMIRILEEKGRLEDFECKLLHKTGEVKNCLTSLKLYPETGILEGSIIDITERKRAEKALRSSEQQLRAYIDHAGDAIYEIDLVSGRILSCNEQACHDLGYSRQELLALSAKDIEVQMKPETVDQVHRQLMTEKVMLIEGVHKRKDGSTYPVEIRLSSLDPARPLHVLAIVRDITERKKIDETRNRLAEAKSKFTATVSHELRTPLTTIKAAMDLVLDGLVGPVSEEQRDLLETTKENIDRLSRLVSNVLVYQKAEAGKMDPDFRGNDVNEVVRSVYKNMHLTAGKRSADLVMDLAKDLPSANFDKDRIFQVLTNLLINAIKYSGSGSIVTQTRLDAHEIHVSVRDSGPGIKAENLEKIFEPFSQVADLQKGGTGLGLAISREIIRAHHGRIWAESEAGKGSTFHFSLPV